MERWIPIVDYAVLKGISTSTLRRYIKAQKIIYKIENGRYLILSEEAQEKKELNWSPSPSPESHSVCARAPDLEQQLIQAQEQINELKMLVAIYEEKLAQPGH